eukprot:CAMPEP_0119325904 /NCGR_PEP_ID=MMETSP1333-20130426/66976_1 /TAXON_ID=418940 /ORGANISM="Scyphosphaera apsteinii, Strain RCC1455" /LENGTH=46 /DNA_ID= /DNA_START= /DNA_END= /DNA_ORIENTATION=
MSSTSIKLGTPAASAALKAVVKCSLRCSAELASMVPSNTNLSSPKW